MIAILLFSSLGMGGELILQNGDDYEGCEDTYVSDDKWQENNFGDAKILSLQGYH